MTLIKKSLILVLVIIGFTLINSQLQAQIPAQLQSCFKNGDSKKLAEYFNKNIELVVLDNDNVYSKAQAQQIVNKFFSQNSPEEFSIIHQGATESARYAIGNLKTKNGSFRVYFLLKSNEGKEYIHQLRIEKQ